jgi:hypothetical protein
MFGRVLGAYSHYKNGFLPYGGGMNDQCAAFPHLMSLIRTTADTCHERVRQAEEARRKAKERGAPARGRQGK